MVHGVLDELVSNDVEPGSLQHLQVGLGVEVAPEHVRAEPALRVIVLGHIAGTEAEEGDTTRSEDTSELVEDRSVLGTRHMDHGVIRDETVEGAVTERQRHEIGLREVGAGTV